MTPLQQLKPLQDILLSELDELDPKQDVFDQLIDLHSKVNKTYGISLDEEDFGSFIQKTFKRRDYKHLLKTMAYQKSSSLKLGAIDELETRETEEELKRLIKGFSLKKFKPSNDHLQECLGLLDDLEALAIQPNQTLIDEFNDAFQQSYGDTRC